MERPRKGFWEEAEMSSKGWKSPLPTQLCGLSVPGWGALWLGLS